MQRSGLDLNCYVDRKHRARDRYGWLAITQPEATEKDETGPAYARHQAVLRAFQSILKVAELQPSTIDLQTCLQNAPDGRRFDMSSHTAPGTGPAHKNGYDTTIVSPVGAGYAQQAALVSGHAALSAELAKNSKYKPFMAAGHRFIPLAIEAYGAWGHAAEELLRTLLPRLQFTQRARTLFDRAWDDDAPLAGVATWAQHLVSTALFRETARMIVLARARSC